MPSTWCEQEQDLCSSATFSSRTLWIPIVASFIAVTIAFGAYCRWRGIRRRRALDVLEALQRAEDDLEERFVDYGEKPTMFDASMKLEEGQSNRTWSSLKPISVWANKDPELDNLVTEPSEPTLSMLASEQVVKLQHQVKKLRSRMRNLNGHREEATGLDDLKLDSASVAFLVSMPSKGEENEDDALPELVFAIEDVPVVA
ncbi:hypothetical protein FRC04_001543 [Tulasnella sp. 424]|nr:hypothetical protein FRC04_001543 [Tulasnella sp. 424]KAG8969086.1 hypothetical protein FRC05_001239 [Tulasnella sp. 425]